MEAPNHFILGRAGHLHVIVFTSHDLCSGKRWRQVQLLADHFWKRFRKEYLPSLIKRVKWNSEQRNLKIGDLVLLADSDTP